MTQGPLDRWFAIEMGSFHRGLVTRTRPLADLLGEEAPVAEARDGTVHPFDVPTLRRFAEVLSPLDRRRLRLPATFHVDRDQPGDAAIQDEVVARLLRALGEVPAAREMRDGRLWLAHSLAQDIARRHPGAFQFVYA